MHAETTMGESRVVGCAYPTSLTIERESCLKQDSNLFSYSLGNDLE